MHSLTEENYLKAIYHLSEQRVEVSVKDIADKLEIKMPTVNSMIKKLAEKALVKYEKYKAIELTDKGRKEALGILRKHRLTELFLTKIMQLGWEEVHDIAEQIEHIESERFFDRIDEMLGKPEFDPHGEPIPDVNGRIPKNISIPLSAGSVNKNYKLARVLNHDPLFLQYLDKIGLAINGSIRIEEIQSFDKSLRVVVNEKINTIFSSEISRNLLIE